MITADEFVKQNITSSDKFDFNNKVELVKKFAKQETLEEVAKNAYKKNSVKDDTLSLDEQIQRSGGFIVGFKEGAKWQQEQDKKMYSEKDMKQFAWECVANFLSNNDNKVEISLVEVIMDRNDKKFEQFKKK